ncbi:MAG: ribosome maturation factor RimP [Holosporaceae bacterium]|nr:ribosome maturation factor RimP [Holosporaceae bacterium]
MNLKEKIIAAVEDSLIANGYEPVTVKVVGGSRPVVCIDIERLDGDPVSMDDCVKANNLISVILDVENFINGPYNLEVSSPGDYRLLTKISDFERFCGKDVKLELYAKINGRRKFSGKLTRVAGNANDAVVYLKEECDTDAVELKMPYKNIKKASIKRFF